MATLRQGMPEDEVLRRLGEPDDRQTELDPGGLITAGTREIWSYGSREHLSFATLGSVTIDTRGRLQYVFGGEGSPPDPALVSEGQLRAALRVVDTVPSYGDGEDFDPLALVRAVNALQPLGRDRALAIVAEYLRVASPLHDPGVEGVMLLLRVLFETDRPPTLHVGSPAGCSPPAEGQTPLFPIVMHQDVPYLVVYGYVLAGAAEPPSAHLAHYQADGRMRASQLHPGPAPHTAPDAIVAGPCAGHEVARLIVSQVLRVVRNAHAPDPAPHAQELDLHASRYLRAVEAVSPRWHAPSQTYRRGDGGYTPDPPLRQYRREIWRPEYDGLDLTVTLERIDARSVTLEARVERARRRVDGWLVAGERRFEVRARPGGSSATQSAVELPEGESLRLRFESGARTLTSDALQP